MERDGDETGSEPSAGPEDDGPVLGDGPDGEGDWVPPDDPDRERDWVPPDDPDRERDWHPTGARGTPGPSLRSKLLHAGVAVALTAFAVLALVGGVVPALVLGRNTLAGLVASLVVGEAGFVAVGMTFVLLSGRGLGFLNLEADIGYGLDRGWGLVAAVTAGVFLFRLAALVAAAVAGIEPASPTVTEVDVPFSTLVAVLTPAMLLVVGPAEELLFRGTIQGYLREAFSAPAAIVGAGALFASIHLLAIVGGGPAGAALSLSVIFVVGAALGWLYERTESLPAAMAAHGAYNAAILLSAYGISLLQ